jgi:hypothetical protein
MNRHLKRVLISLAFTLGVNILFMVEAFGSNENTWHYRLMVFLNRPAQIIGELIWDSRHPNSLMEALLPLTYFLIFYAALAWIALTTWHWVRTGKF